MKSALILFLLVFSSMCNSSMVNFNYSNDEVKEKHLEQRVLANWVSVRTKGKVKEAEARKIVNIVYKESEKTNIDPLLVLAMISKESMFKHNAKSNYGAMGLMQVVPRWHRDKLKKRNPYDRKVSIEVGVKVLTDCLKRRNNNINRALTCYSGGAKNYQSYIKKEHKTLSENLVKAKFENELPIIRSFAYSKPFIDNNKNYQNNIIYMAKL